MSFSHPGSIPRYPQKQFLTTLEHNPDGLAIPDQHLLHARIGAKLAAMLLHGAGDRIADGAHAAPRQAPGADISIDIAHHVMEQNVGRTR